jgi:hypothetical protein
MAENSEKFADDRTEKTNTPTDESSINLPAKKFEPITGKASKVPSRSASKPRDGSRPSSARTLSRYRSNNGYGCDEDDEDVGAAEAAGVQEKDPFEVHWDNGDADPMNPRSKSKFRKWVVVIIVSASSLCV